MVKDLWRTSPRATFRADQYRKTPVQVVWELTLGCTLQCSHCGSRAGQKRPNELNTIECLELVDKLARAGTREINLIGGEAFVRKDWLEIINAIDSHNMFCTVQTSGFGLSREKLVDAKNAGLKGVGVSVDGLRPLHDFLRNRTGSFSAAMNVLEWCAELGIETSVNTQIGPRTPPELEYLLSEIASRGAKTWQVQLTVPMGNAVDNDEEVLQPWQLLYIMPLLARVWHQAKIAEVDLIPGNNIGYFGPYESLWRGPENGGHYAGCTAGQNAIGIESDGTIKACPSLNRSKYSGGNIREMTLNEIRSQPSMQFNWDEKANSEFGGYCGECYYRKVCRGGCTWTADSSMGDRGNNPFCHHRVLELRKRGIRESLVKIRGASNEPFATGEYSLVQEAMPEDWFETVLSRTESGLIARG